MPFSKIVLKELNTKSVKIAMVDKNGWEKILVTGQENYFKNHPRKDADIGLNISGERISMSIPRSPLSIESSSSKSPGIVMYDLVTGDRGKKNGWFR